jgi:hypothetical protein
MARQLLFRVGIVQLIIFNSYATPLLSRRQPAGGEGLSERATR